MAESLKRLIHEVHRRSLWQVLGIYLVGGWIALQVVETLTESLGLPDWVPAFAIVLLVICLPVVLATAFVQEGIGPGGARVRSDDASSAGPQTERDERPDRTADRPDQAETTVPSGPASQQAGTSGARRLLTWRNALLTGGAAFALLGLVTSAYMAMRLLGIGPIGSLVAAGVLEERDRIILADFENNTNDSLLAVVVTEAFRVDLTQSPVVTIVEPDFVREALQRMGRADQPRLDLELAREIAIREGIKAAIGGEVSRAAGSYVLSARLISAESGEILAASRQAAADSGAILGAIDELSRDLRERIGESLKRIRSSPPLHRVTTSSLEALRRYSQGVRAADEGEDDRAIRLLEEAVALDTTFAMAWRKLGVLLQNRGEQRARGAEALRRAFELRDRLTERERYLTEGTYYGDIGETEKAITAYRTLLDLRPDDDWAANNLGLLYGELRDYERAEEMFRRVIQLDSTTSFGYQNLIFAQVAQGELDSAQATLARLEELQPGNPLLAMARAELFRIRGEYGAAEALLERTRQDFGANLFVRARATIELSHLARLRGRLARSERYVREAMSVQEERGLDAGYLGAAALLAAQYLIFHRSDEALAVLERALERHPLGSVAPLDRPYDPLVAIYALAGRTERARRYLAELEALHQMPGSGLSAPHVPRGLVALAEGRYPDAIEEFQAQVDEGDCPVCDLPVLAMAYDSAGQPDSVLAVYERFVTTPFPSRSFTDSFFLAGAYERLGELYEARGNHEQARYYYGKLVDLWEDADPVLQPRVESARRAIRTLSTDT